MDDAVNECEPQCTTEVPVMVKDECFILRERIENMKANIRSIKDIQISSFWNKDNCTDEQFSEMKANLMLAYRHLEDARMRLGKVVQAYDGGTSVYPR